MLDIDIDPDIVLDLVTNHLPNLQDFHLAMAWDGDVTTMLENLPEGIRQIKLDEICRTPSVKPNSVANVVKRHYNLQSIEINYKFARYRSHDAEPLLPFLESCSRNLQILDGLEAAIHYHPKIIQTMNMIGFVWRVLTRNTLYRYETDEDIAKVISLSSQWTNIELYSDMIEPMTMAAIADHCEHLETLKFVGRKDGDLLGSHLQAVLNKAPKLKSLEAPLPNDHDTMITDRDILSSEWATTSLEHLDLKILVPRPTDDFLDNTAVRSSRDIQRQVLRRLGQQKRLRKLVLGGMVVSPSAWSYHHQFSCLEMTLESGLDELVGLKDLEELYIHHMDHHVGVPELEWMAEHFPKLWKLRGLEDAYRPRSPKVLQWLWTHRPGWV
ncbi:hypothetical protein BGW41_003096 [Actinomortierella wolfii]|nr:hypothetical protein BGW41_003096 [Actinomortierella wolfii]